MNQIDNISDALISRIADGNRQAFQAFYDATYPSLYRFVSYFISNKEEREDTISDVYLNIWLYRSQLHTVKNIKSYLYIVSRNEAYKKLNKNKHNIEFSIDDMPIQICCKENSAYESLVEKEVFEIYAKAVELLPQRCKLVFLMVREEKLKHKEVAKMLSITEGTVEKQMNTAIKRILENLKQQLPSLNL